MTTTTQEVAVTQPTLVLQPKFNALEDTLNTYMVERRQEIRAATIALISRTHFFQYGQPGIGKSMLVDLLLAQIAGARGFKILMTKFTTDSEVWGPYSIKGMENDEFVRKLDGYLAEAELAFLDEIWKANSSILNSLLWAFNEGIYRHGATVISIPIGSVFAASNELPTDDVLNAIYDRLLTRIEVAPVRDPTNFKRMLTTRIPDIFDPIMTWDDVVTAQNEARKVTLSPQALDAMVEIRRNLADKNIEPTPRRFNECQKLIRAAAWLDGLTEADVDHLQPLRHALWERPEQQDEVERVVLGVANPFANEARTLLADLETLNGMIDTALRDPEKHRRGNEVHKKLRKAKAELDALENRAGGSSKRNSAVLDVRDRLRVITERLMREVFGLDPDDVAL
jgi:MoxR-like ATPase